MSESGTAGRRPAVKVCGVTRTDDALRAVDLGAAYIGLNFWPRSPRYVAGAQGREIARAVAGRVPLVGVFVGATSDEVERAEAECRLDLLQFHGDEPPEQLAPWGPRAIKVFRIPAQSAGFDAQRFADYPGCGAWLFDIRHADYGGTGRQWNYELVADLDTDRPVFVAGGVRPDNARDIVTRCRPDVLDVCSGVESAPGVKDPTLMQRLFEEIGHEKQIRLA